MAWRIARPIALTDGHRRARERPQRPPIGLARGSRFGHAWIGRAAFHPFDEHRHFVRRQRFLRRHLQVIVDAAYGADEQALLRIAGAEGGPRVAAALPAAPPIEGEAAFHFAGGVAVALEAVALEDGQDVLS